MDGHTDGLTQGQRENSIPITKFGGGGGGHKNKVCWGYNKKYSEKCVILGGHSKSPKVSFQDL